MKMLDTEKLKLLKLISLGLAVILVLGLIFWFGFTSTKSNQAAKEKKPQTKQIKKVEGTEITTAYVRDFLVAYFTKKDLGENRNRYLPL